MEQWTFGNTDAAKVLIDLIGDDSRIKRRAGSIWNDYATMMKVASSGADRRIACRMLAMIRKDARSHIQSANLPAVVRSYLLTCVVSRYRVAMRAGYKQRKTG